MNTSSLRFGTPKADLLMSVSSIRQSRGIVEFEVHPPSPFSHAMTLYAPASQVEVRSLGDNHLLGDMYVFDSNDKTMFVLESVRT